MTKSLNASTTAKVTLFPYGETAESIAISRQSLARMASGDMWPPPAPPNSELTQNIERLRCDLGTVIANLHAQLAELRGETRKLREELEQATDTTANGDEQHTSASATIKASRLFGQALLLENREDTILHQLETLRIDRRLATANLSNKGLLRFGPAWCIGVDEIDERHSTIFDYINLIHTDLMGSHQASDPTAILEALLSFSKQHFSAEEHLMRQQGYPELKLQIEAHKELATGLQDLYDQAKLEGAIDPACAFKIIKHWTQDHIHKVDARYGEFVRDQDKNKA